MKRTTRDYRDMPHPKPVERISLSEKNTKLRFIIVILLILVAVGAFAYGAVSALNKESGWTTIQVDATGELHSGGDFVFRYRLGESGISATAENKAITMLYTEGCQKTYQLFDNTSYYGTMANLYYINRHPNEELEVDSVLYDAFALCESYGIRNIYLAPLYEVYDSIFYCNEDWETASFDPQQDSELADYFSETLAYVQDPSQVQIELLGENRIKLFVSEEYLQYAEDEQITSYIDFYWMKNAFIIDYLADVLLEQGYTRGSISSYDGFVRNLESGDTDYAFNVYDRVGNTIYPAAVMHYQGPKSIVYLRDYPMNSLDFQHYYEMEDGQIRTPYLTMETGLPQASLPNLVSYTEETGCADLLLRMIPVYLTDTFQPDDLPAESIYCTQGTIHTTDPTLNLTDLYQDDAITYTQYTSQ